MKIAFAGLPSTGKTTLISRLRENPEFTDYFVPPSVGRTLKQMGIPINEHGTLKTQIGALSLHLRVIDKYDDIFHERSLIDPVAFSIAEGKFSQEQNDALLEILEFNLKDKPCYDKIFYLPRHIAYVPDGVRTHDEVFLMKLELAFHDVYTKLNLPENMFHIVTSFGIEERYEEVLNFIKS